MKRAKPPGKFEQVKAFFWVTIICLISIEASLRLQQHFGPLYDLEMSGTNLDWYSDEVNHKPARQPEKPAGNSASYVYDELGIRQPVTRLSAPTCRQRVSMLFMGDSFIQGFDEDNTVPNQVAHVLFSKCGICVTAYNSGYSSYSPAIFIPLARRLLPALKPDYVVVDIDETDLADDVHRYEKLITRDQSGRNIGVKATQKNYIFSKGLLDARDHWLYLHRLVAKLWLTYVVMPKVLRQDPAPDVFQYARDHAEHPEQKYENDLAIFSRNIDELVGVLEGTVAKERIIFIRHPHLQNLQPDVDGRLWNDMVGRTVQGAAARNGVVFFDSTGRIKQEVGNNAEKYYLPGDMHYNVDGLRLYARTVADFIAQRIAAGALRGR